MKRFAFVFLCLSCADDFTRDPSPDAGKDGPSPMEERDTQGGDGAFWPDGASVDASSLDVVADAGKDAIQDVGPDAPKCPTNGQGCSNIGDRICDDETHYWYCGGTWTRNDCVLNNPICGVNADGGLYCKGPKCVP